MTWYGEHGIPVELNEPHHWGMRDAPDVIFVVSAFLSAYNARKFGVQDYIAQLMFNSPPGLSDAMDLAKMLAVLEMIGTLETPLGKGMSSDGNLGAPGRGGEFRIWKQTRTGLLSYPQDPQAARGHLAASVYLQMALKPDILHIVGHSEADHAATAEDVIEASRIARRVIDNALGGAPDMTADPKVQNRKEELVAEAKITIKAIRDLAGEGVVDPWADAGVLARAVSLGILDAPQLKNNPFARGDVQTRIVNGTCVAVDPQGRPVREAERLDRLGKELI